MAKTPSESGKSGNVAESKGPSRPFPGHSLEKALVVVQAIADSGAGKPMDRLLVANALGRTPSSSEFKALLSSSLRYGLTTGTEKADLIAPTELGLQIVKPESEKLRSAGVARAVLFPDLMKKIFEHFNRNKYPEAAVLKNTLEKSFGVHISHSTELVHRLGENGKFSGIIQTISGAPYVRIDAPAAVKTPKPNEYAGTSDGGDDFAGTAQFEPKEVERITLPQAQQVSEQPKQLFIAHGKSQAVRRLEEGFGKVRYCV